MGLDISYLQFMKKYLFLLLLFSISFVSAQKIIKTEKVSDYTTHVFGDDFEGVIFKGNYVDSSSTTSFTPSVKEVELAENILRTSLDTIKDQLQSLGKYKRQY